MRAPATGSRLAALMLAWLAGVAIQLQERALRCFSFYVGVAAAGSVALAAGFAWRRRAFPGAILACAGALLAGFALTGGQASLRLADAARRRSRAGTSSSPASLPACRRPGRTACSFRFALDRRVAAQRGGRAAAPRRPRLVQRLPRGRGAVAAAPAEDVRAGQRWRLPLRLRQPHGTLNPHGFDLELWLFERGIGGSGHRAFAAPTPRSSWPETSAHPVERLRQHVRDAIQLRVADAGAAGVGPGGADGRRPRRRSTRRESRPPLPARRHHVRGLWREGRTRRRCAERTIPFD